MLHRRDWPHLKADIERSNHYIPTKNVRAHRPGSNLGGRKKKYHPPLVMCNVTVGC
jgi:hypothetical protein